MFKLKVTDRVRIGHRLSGHPKCRNVHGEYLRVTIVVSDAEYDPAKGVLVDFADVKSLLREVLAMIDHAFIYRLGDEIGEYLREKGFKTLGLPFEPTCEGIAFWIYQRVKERLPQISKRLVLERVEVAESSEDTVAILEA